MDELAQSKLAQCRRFAANLREDIADSPDGSREARVFRELLNEVETVDIPYWKIVEGGLE